MTRRLRQARILALSALLGFLVSGACRSLAGGQETDPDRHRPSVLLITVDTLRADYLSCYGSQRVATPHLDSLAADGALFVNAYCQVPLTPPSHASILTGTYPATHGLRDFTSGAMNTSVPTLASLLREEGYRTAAFVSAFVLDRSWGLDRGFDLYVDDFEAADFEGVNPGNVQRRASETVDRLLGWLAQTPSPYFAWLHLFDPHHDYDPPEPYRSRYANDLYAGEVAYTDSQIGRVLAELRKSGKYESTVIVVTSDHGESLGEHGEQEHGFFLYESVIRVPLIFKLPGSYDAVRRLEGLAQTIDIVPTILQALRLPSHPAVEGRGLLSEILGKRRLAGTAYAETLYPRTTFGWSGLRSYREGAMKLIDAPRPELYDLRADPGETANLFAQQSALGNQLRAKLQSLSARFQQSARSPEATRDEDTLQRLAALGYVSLGNPVAIEERGDLADPKDKIGIYSRVLEGLQAAEAGRPEQSNSILEEVTRSDPGLFIAHHALGNNYLQLRRPAQALSAFETALQLNPGFASTILGKARALADLRRADEAVRWLEESNFSGQDLSARRLLARLYRETRRFTEAVRLYREILRERPADLAALRWLPVALVENRQFAEGLEALDKTLASGLDDALLQNYRGVAAANLGKTEDALGAYRRAIEYNPNYPAPRLNLALTLLQSGEPVEARKQFDQLCRINRPLCERYRSRFQ